jgi:hypothetical protein
VSSEKRKKEKERKRFYAEDRRDAEGAEKRKEEERFLAAQADRFAGANRCGKIGLLRSE